MNEIQAMVQEGQEFAQRLGGELDEYAYEEWDRARRAGIHLSDLVNTHPSLKDLVERPFEDASAALNLAQAEYLASREAANILLRIEYS